MSVEVTRGAGTTRRRLRVVPGTLVRDLLKRVGEAPEGCAVLWAETPIPLDTPVERGGRLVVVPTFSGG